MRHDLRANIGEQLEGMDLLIEHLLPWGHRFLLSGSCPFPRVCRARTIASQDWRVNSGEEPWIDAVSATVLHCLDFTHRRAEMGENELGAYDWYIEEHIEDMVRELRELGSRRTM